MQNLSYSNNQTVIIKTELEISQTDLVSIAYQFVSNQSTVTLLSITTGSITDIKKTEFPDRDSPAFHIKYGTYKYDISQEKNRLTVTHLFNRLTWSEKQQFRLLDEQYHFRTESEIDDCLLDDILDIKSRY